MARSNELEAIDAALKDAFQIWYGVIDDLTGGFLSQGYRTPTDVERIREWDGLTAEQLNALRDRKGADWVIKQGAEIERLRKNIPEMPVVQDMTSD